MRGYARWKLPRLYHFIFEFAILAEDKTNENIELKLNNRIKTIV